MADINEEKDEEKAAAKPGGKKKMVIIIGAAAVVLLGAGAGAYVMMSGDGKSDAEDITEKEISDGGGHGGGGGGKEDGSAEGPPENIHKFVMPFFVTLADTNFHRVLQFSLSVEFDALDKMSEITRYEDKYRDAVYSETATRTRAEVQSPEGKERLRRDLIDRFESLLESPGAISNIYFPDYVLPLTQ